MGFFKLKIHQRSARQTALLANIPAQPKTKEQYFAEWDAWAQEGGPDENRASAVRKLKEWMNADQPERTLSLRALGLTSLPANLPPSVQSLNVSGNALTSLPENLPSSLHILVANDNRLTSLPENLPAGLLRLTVTRNRLTSLPNLPAPLQILNASHNRLTHLPNLPASLTTLSAGHNLLTSLSDNLSPSLQHIEVNDNRLTSLPERITTLGRGCTVYMDNNPFPQRVIDRLFEAIRTEWYRCPRFSFSMTESSSNTPARILGTAVSDWYDEGKDEIKTTWNAFMEEEGAAAFSKFLDRLRGTVSYSDPQFRQSVVAWLSHLADRPQLRQDSFQVSDGATASCEDRVALTYNDMKKLQLTADVDSGLYDNRLKELVPVARGMFRLDRLEEIAKSKAGSLRLVDEIEVYLAYQVKLRDRLDLPLDTPDMRFFNVSYVTPADLKDAEEKVKTAETKDFFRYLSTAWQPWQSVLKRLAPERYEATQEKLIDAMDEEFSRRLDARINNLGLANDDDARREAGVVVRDELEREIKTPLTLEFLQSQKLSHLIAPRWKLSSADETQPGQSSGQSRNSFWRR